MAMFDDKYDPFQQTVIYDEFGIEPFAPMGEVTASLKRISATLEALPAHERAGFRERIDSIGDLFLRVLLNTLILDPLNSKHIRELLAKLPENRRADNMKMPELDISRVFREGENAEIAEVDFKDVEKDPELEADLDSIKELLKTQPEPRHISFES